MYKDSHKVIGYFSYSEEGDVFCDKDACVISGSSESLHGYIDAMLPDRETSGIVKKTRFEEIMQGISRGAAYAFDQESYTRFLPLAEKNGMSDLPALSEFEKHQPEENTPQFIRISQS
ncbi:hypothetical protein Psal006b_03445 (plasmid) [Piscirickettsia salmonis]|uniref:Crp/Fnr family transcriptional regulator n=1 Tax=Piscirickettsia salmonis TaxID=1238 RepID=A0AAC8ZQA2_PISSA|nr:hypothetical protein [Piscirickettsia salmonis]RNC77517.1 hypothetical protein DA717_09860 [Piscirickettsiaceae bacterium NZ-RLO2]ALB24587.1 Crp/Fnr family transcriptional regulator [Piscirickettsia salmonis]ALT18884.1 hypothetical protein PSLF89_08585 [Piscirickettsia salmonis LF-89 = ATCC VR-1361]ALY04465.1 hypothetical protein AWE47_16260 [Piscirickettsia salmonis]APS62143.1 hypothetical protein AVI53_16400 [Piscirickettsia salmonis]